MLWLLSALGFVRKALQAAFAMAMRYPREVAIMLLLVAAAWLWHGKSAANGRADACAAGRAAERASYIAAGKEAERLARAAKAAQEAKYTQLAKDAQDDQNERTAVVRTDADRFIAAGGMRDQAARNTRSAAAPGTQGGNPGIPGPMPDFTLVANTDVRVCSDLGAYAVSAHNWAASLEVH